MQEYECFARVARYASTTTSKAPPLPIKDGKVLLYRGPPAMSNWAYFVFGGIFASVGLQMSYVIYNHFTWPLTFKDPNNQPKLMDSRFRTTLAAATGLIGIFTGFLFWVVPTKTITKLTLLVPTRQLVIRTAVREYSAFLPRALFPRPLRKTAELKGYYLTDKVNERVVPLSAAYRIRGSATAAALAQARAQSKNVSNKNIVAMDERHKLELKVGDDRFWYQLESAGGGEPGKQWGYAAFWRRRVYSLRGKTKWEGQAAVEGPEGRALGAKEPWFADRRTFDDVIPLVKRK
ncbi:hypothetical protein CBS101457_005646 [Exobasidium rhododendri]|nr:hypothetical protein CBS101457_005646 [Exobasidium rhododendri]